MATVVNYEQAGELKIGQVGIANLLIRTLDTPKLVAEMRERVARAPKLFERCAVILDFGGLSQPPTAAVAQQLVDELKQAGVFPIALAYGTRENDLLALQLGLPVLAKFRAQYERNMPAVALPATSATPMTRTAPVSTFIPASHSPPTQDLSEPHKLGILQKSPVRSGQQLYAEDGDLTLLGNIGAGAEVIAAGSIHIYGTLRGRALAGAKGNSYARIFCRDFQAELVAIAGHYKVMDDIPLHLRGKPVQVWLEDSQIKLAVLE